MITKRLHWLLIRIYLVIVFVVDLFTPLGLAVGILYIPALVFSESKDKNVLKFLTGLSVFLEVMGYLFSPKVGIPLWIPITNRVISIFMLFVVYYALKNRIMLNELKNLITICAWSKKVKVDDDWLSIEDFLQRYLQIKVTHGIAPDAAKKMAEEAGIFLKE